jgi:RHS repeat-associated protein
VLTAATVFTREYVFDGLDPVYELDYEDGPVTPTLTSAYAYGNGRMVMMERSELGREPRTYWFHYDGLGSVVALTNEYGTDVCQWRYDEYGNPLQDCPALNHYTYTGQEYDPETGLVHFFARYYDAEVGGWVSQDSYRGNRLNPLTGHRYMFVLGNPVTFTDLYGYGVLKWLEEKVYDPYVAPVVEKVENKVQEAVKPVVEGVEKVYNDYVEPQLKRVEQEYDKFMSNPRGYVEEKATAVQNTIQEKATQIKDVVIEKTHDLADFIQEHRAGVAMAVGFTAGVVGGAAFCIVTAGAGCAILGAMAVGAGVGGLFAGGTQLFANLADRRDDTKWHTFLPQAVGIGMGTGAIGGGGSAVVYNAATGAPQMLSRPRYTGASQAHVQPRHVDLTRFPDKSKFLSGEGGQSFANEVFRKGTATLQPDGRIKIIADLGRSVGTQGETGGRVVMDVFGRIVTQFPQIVP